jgi:hypothetical protein
MTSSCEDGGYQPRYLAYCASHGKTPAQMLRHDRKAWPGGKMCGFILWISARWQEWKKANGRGRWDVLSQADHDNFDAWLNSCATFTEAA